MPWPGADHYGPCSTASDGKAGALFCQVALEWVADEVR